MGSDNRTSARHMQWNEGNIWSFQTTINFESEDDENNHRIPISYKYLVLNGNNIIREETNQRTQTIRLKKEDDNSTNNQTIERVYNDLWESIVAVDADSNSNNNSTTSTQEEEEERINHTKQLKKAIEAGEYQLKHVTEEIKDSSKPKIPSATKPSDLRYI